MAEETLKGNLEDTPVLHILKQIANGTLDPKTLSPEVRQDCVRCMHGLGKDVSSMASVLQVSDKTIRRDKAEIVEKDAKAIPADYQQRLRGDLTTRMSSINDLMMRLANDQSFEGQDRVQAGYHVWKMIKDEIEIARGLGLLPSEAFKIEATADQERAKTPELLKEELARLEKISTNDGSINDPEIVKIREGIRRNIALGEAKQGLARLEEKITELRNAKESSGGQ